MDINSFKNNICPLFICGHRKSGTTLFLNLLDSHPQLSVFPCDSGFFYDYFPSYDSNLFSEKEKKERAFNVLYNNFLSDISDENKIDINKLKNELYHHVYCSETYNPPNLLLSLMFAYWKFSGSNNNTKFWVEKTTSSEIYVNHIFKWFPRAKFIHILRDPRDNFASLLSGWEKRYSKQYDCKNRLLQSMIDRGVLSFVFARENMKRYSNSYMVIRFEDLVNSSRKTMESVCGFLGIKYLDLLLCPTYCGFAWKGNNFDGISFDGIYNRNVGRWAERIDENQAKIIEFFFKEHMNKYNYEMFFSSNDQMDAFTEYYKWFNFTQRFAK